MGNLHIHLWVQESSFTLHFLPSFPFFPAYFPLYVVLSFLVYCVEMMGRSQVSFSHQWVRETNSLKSLNCHVSQWLLDKLKKMGLFSRPPLRQSVRVSTKEGPSGGGVKGKVMQCVGL
uniref:Uncharacterized protein n=1 Tax=Cyprinus carpio TaxID=7962 RepID=A0A8C1G5C8_CYPCA